jgi:hypothetical protein
MHLAQVGLRRISGQAGTVLHVRAETRVALYPWTIQQLYPHPGLLAEAVGAALTDRLDDS